MSVTTLLLQCCKESDSAMKIAERERNRFCCWPRECSPDIWNVVQHHREAFKAQAKRPRAVALIPIGI